ncbi:MAG: hypothetical protein ACKEQK_00470 [Candidatus Hodgkinia cicadicola]
MQGQFSLEQTCSICVDLPLPRSPTRSTRLLYNKPAKMSEVVDFSKRKLGIGFGTKVVGFENAGNLALLVNPKASLKLIFESGIEDKGLSFGFGLSSLVMKCDMKLSNMLDGKLMYSANETCFEAKLSWCWC